MSKYNYDKLMALEPTVYETITNQLNQKIDLVEHPLRGDSAPVIAIYHDEKIAQDTEFFDTEELSEEGGDYNPVYMHGELKYAWEFDL
jgi:hypothetical protein